MKETGCLYVVATPIGNLEDITLRAIRILKEADCILCEDKRVTVRLLNKYKIVSKLISFNKINEAKIQDYVLSKLKNKKNIALVSDAGTPLISDPGSRLISKLDLEGIKVTPVPGPSALACAVSACPFKFDEFLFLGFLPSEKSKRIKLLKSLENKSKLVILFIAPHDLLKYTKEIYEFYPTLEIYMARELTKFHEERWSGSIKDFLNKIKDTQIKGEFVVCMKFESSLPSNKTSSQELNSLSKLTYYIQNGYSLKQASKIVSTEMNVPSKSLYEIYIRSKS